MAEPNHRTIQVCFEGSVDIKADGSRVIITGRPFEPTEPAPVRLSGEDAVQRVAESLVSTFDLSALELPSEYGYSCLPLCLIDAIFSIGVTYASTRNTVRRYCEHNRIDDVAMRSVSGMPEPITIGELIEDIESEGGPEKYAANVLENRQRTSSKNGILKSEAVLQAAEVLSRHGIQTLADFREKFEGEVEDEFLGIPGQGSGISLSYLKMLCGDESLVKPDRHIKRFLEELGVDPEDAQAVISGAIERLRRDYPEITVRKVDYAIWDHMKNRR